MKKAPTPTANSGQQQKSASFVALPKNATQTFLETEIAPKTASSPKRTANDQKAFAGNFSNLPPQSAISFNSPDVFQPIKSAEMEETKSPIR